MGLNSTLEPGRAGDRPALRATLWQNGQKLDVPSQETSHEHTPLTNHKAAMVWRRDWALLWEHGSDPPAHSVPTSAS